MLLEGKVALVTGGGRGLGRAISLRLARDGARVAVADIDGETAGGTCQAIRDGGGESAAIQADVADLDQIDRMVRETLDAFHGLDVFVNNAAVTQACHIMDVDEALWDRIHRVNAKGAFFCMQKVAREMIRLGKGGRIINMSSVAGKGFPGGSNAAYAAAKGGVIAMTQLATHPFARHDINVNSICPGAVRTPMLEATTSERARAEGVSVEEMIHRAEASIPLGRIIEPEDIAEMAAFLAGPGGRNIAGQAFNVDGGVVMH
jgi:NAD(P)-dependent dehydrogenase (short-subunit alcohol dehydrogenase family)